jgi:predicted transcriptional regulator
MPANDAKLVERRELIAAIDFETTFALSGMAMAERLLQEHGIDVSQPTVSADRKSEEYEGALKRLKGGRLKRIRTKGMELLEQQIDAGLDAQDRIDKLLQDTEITKDNAQAIASIAKTIAADKALALKAVALVAEKTKYLEGDGEEDDGNRSPVEKLRDVIRSKI